MGGIARSYMCANGGGSSENRNEKNNVGEREGKENWGSGHRDKTERTLAKKRREKTPG